MLTEIFRLCYFDDTDGDSLQWTYSSMDSNNIKFHTSCRDAIANSLGMGTDVIVIEAISAINESQNFPRSVEFHDEAIKRLSSEKKMWF